MRSHGGEGKPLRGPGLRRDGRLRGDRLRAQAHGPPQPPLRTETLQRAARGDRHVPELAHEDVEGTRGGRDRGAEGPSGPARRGRVPAVAERGGALRGGPGPGAVGNGLRDAKGNPIDARSVAALNRLRRVSQWTRYDRTERALAPGLAQLSSLSSRLGLAPAFRERAAIILRKAIEAGLSRGRSMD